MTRPDSAGIGDGGADEIDVVLAIMAVEPLDPHFLFPAMSPDDRPFENAAKIGVRNPEYERNSSAPEWIDGEPIHPERPDAIRFFGNFFNLSRVFCIDTDDAKTVRRLREAIAANMATEAFRRASDSFAARGAK